ncbi:MAG: hybrid sensor histidine kinase/response regulator, partial [Candidatus Riflebacteria bacterium]
ESIRIRVPVWDDLLTRLASISRFFALDSLGSFLNFLIDIIKEAGFTDHASDDNLRADLSSAFTCIKAAFADFSPETESQILLLKQSFEKFQISSVLKNQKEALSSSEFDSVVNNNEGMLKSSLQDNSKIRAPQSDTVRISVDILDKLMVLAGELVLVRNQQLFSVDRSDPGARAIVQRLDIVTTELQETVMFTRMQPIGNVFNKFPRMVRDLAKGLDKQIELVLSGSEVELDKTIIELLADPLTHLIRNSCDHGLESPQERLANGKPSVGVINLRAFHEGGQINILIADDGRGINAEAVRRKALDKNLKTSAELAAMTEKEIMALVMLPGFSTAAKVTDLSGRGVGMDVVKSNIEKLGGTLDFDRSPGKGTSFHLRLPLTLAIIPCLIVRCEGYRYAIPQFNVEELVSLSDEDALRKVEVAGEMELYRLRDRLLPLVRLNEILRHPEPFTAAVRTRITEFYRHEREQALASMKKEHCDSIQYSSNMAFAVVKVGGHRFGLIVDQVVGTEEIVVRPMHPAVKKCSCFSGATIMGDGQVALILDIEGIARHAGNSMATRLEERRSISAAGQQDIEAQNILLFKVGADEQFAVPVQLLKRIERFPVSAIEKVGHREYVTLQGVSTMILRIDSILPVSRCIEKPEMYMFLPKFMHRPFGILFSEIKDIVNASVSLSAESGMGESILGTSVLNNHLTLFLDIFQLIEKAEPGWFADRRRKFPAMGSKKILVVDDSSFIRQLLRGYLESDGYTVETAANGEAALRLLREKSFDMLISDLEMPIMNGWDLVKKMRQFPDLKDLPAIAITALESESASRRAIESGFNRFELKVNREGFLAQVASLFQDAVGKPKIRNTDEPPFHPIPAGISNHDFKYPGGPK